MRLENLENEDLLNLLEMITSEIDQMFFLVDNSFRIKLCSKAFSSYVKKDNEEIFDRDYGEVLGCGNMIKEGKNCAFTSYCRICEIRKHLHLVFSGKHEKLEFETIREFKVKNEILVRHLTFKLISIAFKNSNYALCLLHDNQKEDELTMLINPEESI